MGKINKKGVTDTVLMVIVEISIIALIILLGFYVVSKLLGSGADANTLSFFNALSDNVQLMIDKPTDFEYQRMVYYATENERYYVFGFTGPQDLTEYKRTLRIKIGPPCGSSNSNSGYVAEMETTNIENYPKECNGRACLCLYKLADNVKDFLAKPVKCKAFDGNVVFHGYFDISQSFIDSNPGMFNSWTSLFLQDASYYSDYPDNLQLKYRYLAFGPACINPQDVYIEKFKSGATTHILITPYLSGDQIRERTSLLSPCPEGSNLQCMGVDMNQNTGNGICLFDEDQQICIFKDNVAECEVGPKLLRNCTCDTKFVEVTSYNNFYCYRRLKDQKLVVLKFDCGSVNVCADYCTAITDTAGCVHEEVDYCNQDPCNKNCLAKPNGAKYDCISYYIP